MSAPNDLIAGRYRLVHRVGRGGMGVVWEAWDERLHRKVAVKQLHAQLGLSDADTELANLRAMREARITARLDHPHAVPVFDVVEHEGQPCLIMQFLPSTPLSEVLRERQTLPLTESARIGAQIASALAAAHRAGIVHRDVKPGNVLIAKDGTARISDFGISHALGDTTLTATGMVHGTPAYLAPEVARGADSTFASDVFGLGATLYTTQEGAPPFGKDQNSIALLHKVASGVFAPPTHSGTLTSLLLRMLAADPAERPDMGAVARTLTGLAAESGAEPDTLRFAEADISTVASDVPRPERPWTRRTSAASLPAAAAGTGEPVARATPGAAAVAPVTGPPSQSPGQAPAQLRNEVTPPPSPAPSQPPNQASAQPPDPPPAQLAQASPPATPAPRRRRGLLWATLSVVALLGLAIGVYALVPGGVGRATTSTSSAGPDAPRSSAGGTGPSSSSSSAPSSSAPSSSAPSVSKTPTSAGSSSSASAAEPSASASSSESTSSTASTSPTASASPSASSPSPTDNPKVGAQPSAAQLSQAISGYYNLMPGNTDQGWSRLTSSYQRNRAKGRSSYERFWADVDRVSVSSVQGNPPDRAQATVRYVFKDGRVVRETTSYGLVVVDGELKINRSTVLSSQ